MAKNKNLEPEISEKETEAQNEDFKPSNDNKDEKKPQTLRKFSKFQKGNK